ncbi:AAA family ATPase [Nocardia sp. NPDC058633]|uniref:AAA family ATPase n=1 Tax=Nocardia sp. NPDC058633 TaxID=3346568 RepID=UPI00366534E7
MKNWRSYADATFKFEPGTTFVVAPNGIGKTSLVEAARWGLFGISTADGRTAVRAGEDSATVTVELDLPGQRILEIERKLSGKNRAANFEPNVRLNGDDLPPEKLNVLLCSLYSADPEFLAGLTMPSRMQGQPNPIDGDLEEHLGHYYGIDTLRSALARLNGMNKTVASKVRGIKAANASTAKQLLELQSEVDVAAQRIVACTTRYETLQARVEVARSQQRYDIETHVWRERKDNWTTAFESITAAIYAELGRPVTVDSVEATLEEELAKLRDRAQCMQVDLAVCREKSNTLALNQQRLDSAHNDCPVCRRPLDDTTVETAHQTNQHDIDELQRRIGSLEASQTDTANRLEIVVDLQRQLKQIPHPGLPPIARPQEQEDTPLAELTSLTEDALHSSMDAHSDHQHAKRRFDDARTADQAMRELESLFTREAKIKIAIETTRATLTELLDDTIRPLAAEINQRWQKLLPDRGRIDTHSDGSLTRTVNGQIIPFEAFSTGEGMTATILVRLLVAQLVTTTDFCWFDEPLEHLDPDVRRNVASILSRAASGQGSLKQVVVTTYEERLARSLIARDGQYVHIVDVRRA